MELKSHSSLAHFTILQTVKTPDGIGKIISIVIPSNGLYFEPTRVKYIVWYGTENSQNGWIQREYNFNELKILI
jgi:hypothetical protein